MHCRHCGTTLTLDLIDLGSAPPSNAYLSKDDLRTPEKWFPLQVRVCEACWLVQTEDYAHFSELFSDDYAYFSSYSKSWLLHAEHYVKQVVQRFNLGLNSHVVEVASNDGYLLQYVQQQGIPCLGIEPTASTAQAARAKGISIVEEFFGLLQAELLAARGFQADLMIANNVLAHVPDINDFVSGFARLLKPHGVATFEFPHLLNLVQENQFDTIYHEHFSYLSLLTVQRIFDINGLGVFDVELLPTHGGSLRVYAQRKDYGIHLISDTVSTLLNEEKAAGMEGVGFYQSFQKCADQVKNDLVHFLIETKRAGKRVAAYGAAAKGNTLMNYAGVRPDLVEFVVDRNPAKQGKYMPGSRIPILGENALQEKRPDYILVLPWNLRNEVFQQLQYAQTWGAKFVTAVPNLAIH